MQLIVENYRGINRADIQLSDKITLIAGRNRAGKSSLIQSLQAVMTGEPLPISGLKKKDANALVRGNHKSGQATFISARGTLHVTWPSCKFTQHGTKYQCSPYAAGLLTPAAIPAKDLSTVLNILPAFDDFQAEMEMPAELNPPTQQIWDMIQRAGWDDTHNRAVMQGRDLKRDWERLSGENWGPQKAREWRPEHYTEQPLEALETALRTAEKLYEHTVKSQALGEKERQDLQELADQHDGVQQNIAELTKQCSEINLELDKAKALLQTLPKILNEQKAYQCWSCGALGLLQGDKMIQPPDKTSEEEIGASRQRIAEQNQVIRDIEAKGNQVAFALHTAQAKLSECEKAKQQLQQIVLDAPTPAMSAEDARAEIELCRKRIAAHKTHAECSEISDLLGVNGYICEILHPEGLRKQVLVKRLASFNELLAAICTTAEWPLIIVDEYLCTRFDGQPYALLSVGEKFAVNAALQIAIAKLDGSEMVIIDGIDVLDRYLRNGLISILAELTIPSVIGCTFNSDSEVPDLGDPGLSYWCENGSAVRLSRVPVTA